MKVASDPDATLEQKVACGLYLAFSVFFLATAAHYAATNGPMGGGYRPYIEVGPKGPSKAQVISLIKRFGMKETVVTDRGGREVSIWGQPKSRSTTEGHPETIARTAESRAKSGRYDYVLMQRSLRTAVGRSMERGEIPDLVGVRRDGRVDIFEVRSNSQSRYELRIKVQQMLKTLPPNMRGKGYVLEPTL